MKMSLTHFRQKEVCDQVGLPEAVVVEVPCLNNKLVF